MLRRGSATAPILLVLVALLVAIAFVQPYFFEPSAFLAFLRRAAPLVILAAGQYFVIVSGEFDLSVGSLVTAEVVIAARLLGENPDATPQVILLLLFFGALIGVVNGAITTGLRVPSFITTLGMLLVLEGAVFLWTGGAPRGALTESFRMWGREGIEGVPLIGEIPYAVLVLLAVGVAAVLLMRGSFGRRLMATGDNERAAALAGVRVPMMRLLAFVLSGVAAAVAAILLGGYSGVSAQVGLGLEFQAITAVVLGGVLLGGGRGSVVAAMTGALTLVTLFTLLNYLGAPSELDPAIQGVIIIAAVALAGLWRPIRRPRRTPRSRLAHEQEPPVHAA